MRGQEERDPGRFSTTGAEARSASSALCGSKRAALPSEVSSMRRSASYFLHQHRHSNRSCLHDLHQRVWHIHIRVEDRDPAGARCIDRIGRGRTDFFHMLSGPGDGNSGRIGVDFNNLIPVRKVASHARMNLDIASQARIKSQVQLAGNYLNHGYISRMAHLQGGEFESAFAGFHIRQFDFRVDFAGLKLPDNAFRATDTDLRLGNHLGTDLELRGNMLEDDGRAHRHLGGLLVGRNEKPKPRGQKQRQELQPEVVQEIALKESDHDCGSDSAPDSDFRCGAGSRKGDSNSASDSSSPRAMVVGKVTGAMKRRSSLLRRSRSCSTDISRSIWPPMARLIAPVSSEQMTAMASVSSVMPMPARWRVPSWVESKGFMESGRKHAAAAMRSFCTITEPSCRGALGRKIVASRS